MRDTEADPKKRQDGPSGKDDPVGQPLRIRPIPESAIWWGTATLLVIAVVAVWLLIAFFGGGSPQDKIRLEAIKLAGSIVVGTGGAVALVLAARRQRTTELQLLQQERTATDTRHDAEERRISDLQASAGEQLGSEKAAVRLNGLYQLARLGQNHPDHRQTVVDVMCAYLRMPFTPPDQITDDFETTSPKNDQAHKSSKIIEIQQAREEHQVRLTAQGILASHLSPKPALHIRLALGENNGQSTSERFWDNITLTLDGAVLTNFSLFECHIARVFFQNAHFYGEATEFSGAHFQYVAEFSGAHFHDKARFRETQFRGLTGFHEVHFHDEADFHLAHFHGSTWFQDTRFHNRALFNGAHFQKLPAIRGAQGRWDVERGRYDEWPTGWALQSPENEEDGHIDGQDGIWGYIVEVTAENEGSRDEAKRDG